MSDVLTEDQEALAAYRAGKSPADMSGDERSGAARALAAEGQGGRFPTGQPKAPGTVAVPESAIVARGAERSVDPADGMRALNLLSGFHQHYDYLGCQEYADLLAAFAFQCAAVQDDGFPVWKALGRILIAGPFGNGKSLTTDNIALTTGAIIPIDLSYAGLRDALGKDKKTVIIDDAQMTFGSGKESKRVRKIVNAHTRGRSGLNAGGDVNVHGNMVLAGLAELVTGKVSREIGDTLSRCWILWKPRMPQGYHVDEVTEEAEELIRGETLPIVRQWCLASRDLLKARAAEFGAGAPTGLPDLGDGGRGIHQLARPLLSVCDVATALVDETIRKNLPREEWDWSARIRKALIYVAGVPERVEAEGSPLERVREQFAEMWAADKAAHSSSGDDGDYGDED